MVLRRRPRRSAASRARAEPFLNPYRSAHPRKPERAPQRQVSNPCVRLQPTLVSFVRLVAAALSAAGVAHAGPASPARATARADGYLVAAIRQHRRETWRWQRLIGEARTPAAAGERDPSHAYRRWVRNLWRRRAAVARRRAANPPHRGAWTCIHGHEGAWNDPNSPYYGGLQMDLAFQRAWGAGCSRRKAPRTGGRRSSRCGSRSGRTAAASALCRGRTRRGCAASASAAAGGLASSSPGAFGPLAPVFDRSWKAVTEG